MRFIWGERDPKMAGLMVRCGDPAQLDTLATSLGAVPGCAAIVTEPGRSAAVVINEQAMRARGLWDEGGYSPYGLHYLKDDVQAYLLALADGEEGAA